MFTGLALLPDLDGLALVFRPEPGSVWRHRGASHSLLLAAGAALVATALVGGLGRSRWRTFATALAVTAGHGLLDALTRGAGGPMLLWPFSTEKILFPFAFIPASPLLPRLFTPRGVEVMLRELILFGPLFLYGLWPSRGRPRGLAPSG